MSMDEAEQNPVCWGREGAELVVSWAGRRLNVKLVMLGMGGGRDVQGSIMIVCSLGLNGKELVLLWGGAMQDVHDTGRGKLMSDSLMI